VRLTFNRPEKLNALSTPLVRALDAALDALAADKAVRAVILTGAGERDFAAGADIAAYQGNRSRAFAAYQMDGSNYRPFGDRSAAMRSRTT
jgi:enoyl-CoA hydratase